jgi:DNA polymerase III alpha subunit (gram-positive type)
LTGITIDKLKKEGKPLKVVLDEISNIWKGFKVSYYLPVFVGHNFSFDQMYLEYVFDYVYGKGTGKNGVCKMYDFVLKSSIDTMVLARQKFINGEVANFKLETIGEYLGINNQACHDAFADVEQTAEIFRFMISSLRSELDIKQFSSQRKEMNFQF